MFNFFKHYWMYFAISLAFLGAGVFFLITSGLKPAIDFTGGSLLEVEIAQELENPSGTIQAEVEDIVPVSSVQRSGTNTYVIRTREIDNATKNIALEQLAQSYQGIRELRFETVGPVLGQELLIKTLVAVLLVAIVIMLYVMRQFSEVKYGISAIIAMFHDSLMLFGAFAMFGYFFGTEVDVLFVTAVLTTLSFSIHDTIVVFDRIRELRHKFPAQPIHAVADIAVKQTLSRSLNNSMTIIIMLATLALLGGDSIRWFVVALLIGAITGTYSSTFTAVPLLLLWEDVKKRMKRQATVRKK